MNRYLENAAYEWSDDSVRLIATPTVMAKSMLFYVQEAGLFQTKPGYFTERENLNSYLIVYTLQGKGTLKYKGKTYTLTAGSLFFIDCMAYQYYETNANDLWKIVWVHFNGNTSQGYFHHFMRQGTPVVQLSSEHRIPGIIQNLIRNLQQKDAGSEWKNSKLLVDLLTEVLLSSGKQWTVYEQVSEQMDDIIRDLEKRFHEPIQLDELSARHAMSKFQLAKKFKAYTGFAPLEYVIRLRINYAKEMLAYSDMPVSEISETAGVENVSHFINLFKAREGVTPFAYRKAWRQLTRS